MRLRKFKVSLHSLLFMALLASTGDAAWAIPRTCDYPQLTAEPLETRLGGTGMGGTGAVSNGTGIGGTGVSPNDKAFPTQVAGNVIYSQGRVEANSHGLVRSLSKGDAICVGETIVTARSGMLQIKMADEGLVAIRPGTKFKVVEYAYNETNDDTSVFALLSGATRFVTGRIGKRNPQNDLVKTPTATIGVRGTDHEATVILADDGRGFPAGTYDKVNAGVTFIKTDMGEIELHPNQVGLAAYIEEMPILLPDVPEFFVYAPYLSSVGNLPEGLLHNRENLDHLRGDTSHEPYGNELNGDRALVTGVTSGDLSDDGLVVIPDASTVLGSPESGYAPELPESQSLSELPELSEIPQTSVPQGD